MDKIRDTFVILSPAFAAHEGETWLPTQERLVLALNKNYPRLKVIVLTFHFPVQKERRYRWHGNEIVTFSGNMRSGLHTLNRWRRVWQELKRINRSFRIVGLFSYFCSETAFIGHYFGKRYGLPHHIWVSGQDARAENRQVRRINPGTEELVCMSDFLVNEFERNHGIRPKHVIPNFVDAGLFESKESSDRPIDLLGVGSLIPLKQYNVFNEVVHIITQEISQLKAEIIGGGPEELKLKSQIGNLGLEEQLVLSGKLNHADVLKKMQHSKILLHTSSYEGFPTVCLEALHAGMHVISFFKPMNVDIEHWHIVDTPAEMAGKAIELLRNKHLDYNGVTRYEVNEAARQIMHLYGYS